MSSQVFVYSDHLWHKHRGVYKSIKNSVSKISKINVVVSRWNSLIANKHKLLCAVRREAEDLVKNLLGGRMKLCALTRREHVEVGLPINRWRSTWVWHWLLRLHMKLYVMDVNARKCYLKLGFHMIVSIWKLLRLFLLLSRFYDKFLANFNFSVKNSVFIGYLTQRVFFLQAS